MQHPQGQPGLAARERARGAAGDRSAQWLLSTTVNRSAVQGEEEPQCAAAPIPSGRLAATVRVYATKREHFAA